MNTLIKKTRNLAYALALGLALTATVNAAPTVSTFSGATRVELSSTFIGALTSLGVSVSREFPAHLRDGVAGFPIPAGEIDLSNAKGEIVHTGGLNLKAGDLTVTLSSFVIDTTGAAPKLTGIVKANDSIVGRITLFDLKLNEAPQAKEFYRGVTNIKISNVDVTLSAEAAAALNDAFKVTAFTAGIPIGKARVNTLAYDPNAVTHSKIGRL
jgi:hypothetical protein